MHKFYIFKIYIQGLLNKKLYKKLCIKTVCMIGLMRFIAPTNTLKLVNN